MTYRPGGGLPPTKEKILMRCTIEDLITELSQRDSVKTINLTAKNIHANVEELGLGSDWVRRTPVVSPATILVVNRDYT